MRWKEVMLVVDDARAVHLLAAVAAVWAGQGLTWSWADSSSSTPPLLICSLLHLIFLLFVPFFCWNKLSSSKLQSLL
jgi:hypothetical protein